MAGEQGVDHPRDDRAVVAEDAGEEALAGGELAPQVGPHFGVDGPRPVAAALQFAEGLGPNRRRGHQSWASSQRSASIAARQPVPAAVTA